MFPLVFLAALSAVTFSFFSLNTFKSFSAFNKQTKDLTNWQHSALAGATRVSKETNNFLYELQTLLNTCVEGFDINQPQACNQTTTPAQLYANYQTRLSSSLGALLQRGLNLPVNQQTYSFKLLHSDYLPDAFKLDDKNYASTLITQDKVSAFLESNDFVLDSKLRIHLELVKRLTNSSFVIQYPELFGLIISDAGLSESQLATGFQLEVGFKPYGSKPEDKPKSTKYLATAQLRIKSFNLVKEVISNPPQPPIQLPSQPSAQTPVTNNPPAVLQNIVRQQINFKVFDFTNRGILFDQSKPASANNPIRIVNNARGGLTSIYVSNDNYLDISIGSVAQRLELNPPLIKDFRNLNFIDRASLEILSQTPIGQANIINRNPLDIDIIPRGRKRYTVASRDFVINGYRVPANAVIIGSLKDEIFEARPDQSEFRSYRVYHPDTGEIIGIFSAKDLQKSSCRNGSCFDIERFYTSPGTYDLGAKIFSKFSTRDLFTGKDAMTANELWVRVQRDLEVNTVYDVYTDERWKTVLEDDYNSQQRILVSEALASQDEALIRKFFGLVKPETSDVTLLALENRNFRAFIDFIEAKNDRWNMMQEVDRKTDADNLDKVRALKTRFSETREDYLAYLRKPPKKEEPVVVVQTPPKPSQPAKPEPKPPAPKAPPKNNGGKKK